ncbi:hypothetical protein [Photobacterium damselae]|uniref:hypothetical protein n=1 Tax=Photobacterium damselae TaxID=38293 RepID=UPI004067821B
MKSLLIFIFCFVFAPCVFAKTDTELHIEYTAAISSGTGFFCQRILNLNKIESFGCGFGAGMIAGVAKEIMDSKESGNNFSGRDIRNDLIGSLVGSLAYRIADDMVITPIIEPHEHYYGVNLEVEI